MIPTDEIEDVARGIRPWIRETEVMRSPWLEADTGAEVWLKLENRQTTGSFKARGAMSKLLSLDASTRARGVVAASSGNHGAAIAYGAKALDCPAIVYVPTYASPTKVRAIRDAGAEVRVHGEDCVQTEAAARAHAEAHGQVYASPYNDRDVVLGQASIGVELAKQLPDLDAVFVAVGGGGMIGGIGQYLKGLRPETQMIACSPARSPAMHACLEAGHIMDVLCHDTLSDATAGGVEAEAVTFPLCQEVVDRSLLVDEEAIRDALVGFIDAHHMLIEGSAAVAIAGWRQVQQKYQGRRVAVVVCGANISSDRLREVLA